MNDLKRNRNSLIYVVLLAFIAGGIGIYLSGDVPRKAEEVNSGGGFKAFAVGHMAAFLVKADRPAVPDLAFKDSAGSEVKLKQMAGPRGFAQFVGHLVRAVPQGNAHPE